MLVPALLNLIFKSHWFKLLGQFLWWCLIIAACEKLAQLHQHGDSSTVLELHHCFLKTNGEIRYGKFNVEAIQASQHSVNWAGFVLVSVCIICLTDSNTTKHSILGCIELNYCILLYFFPGLEDRCIGFSAATMCHRQSELHLTSGFVSSLGIRQWSNISATFMTQLTVCTAQRYHLWMHNSKIV